MRVLFEGCFQTAYYGGRQFFNQLLGEISVICKILDIPVNFHAVIPSGHDF